MDALLELANVLREARALLALPSNDFAWSSWPDARAALSEIDQLLAALERGEPPERHKLTVLFAPTGPIQEVSLRSGWAREFLSLSERFDVLLERVFFSRLGQ
jgi:hypothetical protein